MKKLLQKLGHSFAALFSGIEKVWNRQTPETKESIINASSLVSYMNNNPDMSAEDLATKLQEQFPAIGADKLAVIAADYGLEFDADDYVTIVAALQEKLKSVSGGAWAKVSNYIAKGIALLTAPEGVAYATIDFVATWAYHRYVKKDSTS